MKLKCIYCNSLTTIREVNIEKKYKKRIIAVKNVPVHYCAKCSENFYCNDMLKIVRYAITNMSSKRQIIQKFILQFPIKIL